MSEPLATEPAAAQPSWIVRFLKRRWLSVLLFVVVIIFIAQNSKTVDLRFLWWSFHQTRLWLVLAIVFVVGMLTGAVTLRRRQKRKIKALA